MNWITCATDPFHDTEVTPTGYPDMNSCSTITQCYTFTENVVAPVAGIWDAHFVFVPISRVIATATSGGATDSWMLPVTYQPSTAKITGTTTGVRVYGGLNACTAATGVDPFTTGTTTSYYSNLQMPKVGGQFRLVAAGFEVVNTTPELYKGGSVTCYRSPSQPAVHNAHVIDTLGLGDHILTTTCFNGWPRTQANAQLYPNSRTWAAEQGVYSICTQCSDENRFRTLMPFYPMITDAPSVVDIATATNKTAWFGNGVPINNGTVKNLSAPLSYDYNGCIFTGLNPNATLQVTVKYYIERIPTFNEPDLLVLTRPPSPFDPMALEIYTRVIQELSVAVPVGENPLGEWFSDILGVVGQFAPKIGRALTAVGDAVNEPSKAPRAQARPPPRPRKTQPKNQRKNENKKATTPGVMSGKPKNRS